MNIHFKSLLFIIFSINTIMLGQDLDLLFINGRIMDGTGNPWYYGDVGIKDGKINYIGRSPDKPVARKLMEARKRKIFPHTALQKEPLSLPVLWEDANSLRQSLSRRPITDHFAIDCYRATRGNIDAAQKA